MQIILYTVIHNFLLIDHKSMVIFTDERVTWAQGTNQIEAIETSVSSITIMSHLMFRLFLSVYLYPSYITFRWSSTPFSVLIYMFFLPTTCSQCTHQLPQIPSSDPHYSKSHLAQSPDVHLPVSHYPKDRWAVDNPFYPPVKSIQISQAQIINSLSHTEHHSAS